MNRSGQQPASRMAGMIAGQMDRLGQLDFKMSHVVKDFEDHQRKLNDQIDLRLRKLEEVQGVQPPKANLLCGTGAAAKAKASPAIAGGLVAGTAGLVTGTAGALGGRENEEMLALVMGKVRQMVVEATDMKSRLSALESLRSDMKSGLAALEALTTAAAAPDPPGEGSAASRAAADAVKVRAAADAMKISEASAEEARRVECQRLRDELSQNGKLSHVTSVFSMEDSVFDEVKKKHVDGEDVNLNDEVRHDAARQYVERQKIMEGRLKQLEGQLDSSSVVMPDSQIFTSLKAVIKDVRRCLSRCELLYQLPEIKTFVQIFHRSRDMNAILHEKWAGGSSSRPSSRPTSSLNRGRAPSCQSEESLPSRPGSAFNLRSVNELNHQLNGDNELSRSAPELARPTSQAKRDGVKKKPFRSVVDWCRPHTPLNIDPVYKGGNGAASRAGEDRATTPLLPQIK